MQSGMLAAEAVFENNPASYPLKINQSEIAKQYGVSRPTIKKWIKEIRDEQIREIETNTLSEEIRLLEEKSKRYAVILSEIQSEYFHIWPDNIPSLLNLIKLQWNIEKDVFTLKLGLLAKKLTEEQLYKVNTINTKLFSPLEKVPSN
jgi:hypothetical protein